GGAAGRVLVVSRSGVAPAARSGPVAAEPVGPLPGGAAAYSAGADPARSAGVRAVATGDGRGTAQPRTGPALRGRARPVAAGAGPVDRSPQRSDRPRCGGAGRPGRRPAAGMCLPLGAMDSTSKCRAAGESPA